VNRNALDPGPAETCNEFQRRIDRLLTELRTQATDIEHLQTLNEELETRTNLLHNEVSRLKRAQRTNIQELAHVAAALVSLSKAKSMPLDATTVGILRRRGWLPSRGRTRAGQP